MQSTSTTFKAVPVVGTCPKCGSTQIERGPAFTPLVHGAARSAPSKVEGRVLPIESLAANSPSIRCVACNSSWHESEIDPSSERFAFLKSQYEKGA